jgi:hypothetical protein
VKQTVNISSLDFFSLKNNALSISNEFRMAWQLKNCKSHLCRGAQEGLPKYLSALARGSRELD